MRKDDTAAECVMWELLRSRRFLRLKFRRQHPFKNFILDFFCEELGLVIELDGAGHLDAVVAERDDARTAELQKEGLTVVRIENDELLHSPEYVLARMRIVVDELRRLQAR
jgi:very-short-patch-repair endonuclease